MKQLKEFLNEGQKNNPYVADEKSLKNLLKANGG